MTEEQQLEESPQIAPGLAMALSPEENSEDGARRRGPDPLAALRSGLQDQTREDGNEW